jgi:hypothetical protein
VLVIHLISFKVIKAKIIYFDSKCQCLCDLRMERKFSEIDIFNLSNETKINPVSSLEVVQETNIHKVVSSPGHLKYKRVKRQNNGTSTSTTVSSRTFLQFSFEASLFLTISFKQ